MNIVLFTRTLAWALVSACAAHFANAPAINNGSLVLRGEYLAEFGGCSDCHTPKLMTPKPRARYV